MKHNMQKPLFSILIPAYKDQFFKDCMDSILAQSYADFEVIVVNDASPHPINDIINQYDDPRIEYHINIKGYGAVGLVKNWNNGLKYVKGEYVICMGDDDLLLPTCLENYKSMIDKNPGTNIFHTRAQIINEKNEIIDLQANRPEHESVYSMIWHHWKGRRQYIGDYLFKTSTLKQNGGFFYTPCAWASDDISSFIAAKDSGIVNTNEFGFQYRMSSSTITNSNYAYEKSKAHLKALEWYMDFLKNVPDDEMDKTYRNLLLKKIPTQIYNRIYDKQIMVDLKEHPLQIFTWMKRRQEFSLSTRRLLGIWHMALRNKGLWI